MQHQKKLEIKYANLKRLLFFFFLYLGVSASYPLLCIQGTWRWSRQRGFLFLIRFLSLTVAFSTSGANSPYRVKLDDKLAHYAAIIYAPARKSIISSIPLTWTQAPQSVQLSRYSVLQRYWCYGSRATAASNSGNHSDFGFPFSFTLLCTHIACNFMLAIGLFVLFFFILFTYKFDCYLSLRF